MSAQIEATTEWRPLRSVEEARIVGANKGFRVSIGGRTALVDFTDQPLPNGTAAWSVLLDFASDSWNAPQAPPECEAIVRRMFPELESDGEITRDYVDSLARIYKDVLGAFMKFDPTRRSGEGLALQSLHSVLADKYAPGEVQAACLELERGGAVTIRKGIFAHPTPLGERLITAVTGEVARTIPPFVPPGRP